MDKALEDKFLEIIEQIQNLLSKIDFNTGSRLVNVLYPDGIWNKDGKHLSLQTGEMPRVGDHINLYVDGSWQTFRVADKIFAPGCTPHLSLHLTYPNDSVIKVQARQEAEAERFMSSHG
ncbi:MAG: hypothetical protein A2381_15250 [Bdellovibrionales bacterium RIFOXYB1_FULL_37_110]|nr:MAG: hypothetical protein A2381_15250 [Bdellovibrionales bacterium RIFOXYB1_FULL_37_110]